MATSSNAIKLDDQTRERLKKLGEKRDRSPHWLMRDAIEQYLKREEAYEQEKSEDMARWEQYLLTGRAIANADVERRLQKMANTQVDK